MLPPAVAHAVRHRLNAGVAQHLSHSVLQPSQVGVRGHPTVESQTNAADAATITGSVHFVLTPIAGGDEVINGDAVTSAVYDRTIQRFADLRAQRDVELRLARALASEIELRVAAALAEKH